MSRNTPPSKRQSATRPGATTKSAAVSQQPVATTSTSTAKIALAWAFVGLPLAWGVVMTVRSALALFA